MASEELCTAYRAVHVKGNRPEAHDETATRLRVSDDERVLCDALSNQSWLTRVANRGGGFDFDAGYRPIVSDK